MIGGGLRSGELHTPEDGPISWTARDDLAEADAVILASDGAWDGITPPLTAADAITMAQLAAIASEVTPLGHTLLGPVMALIDWSHAHQDAIEASRMTFKTEQEKAIDGNTIASGCQTIKSSVRD